MRRARKEQGRRRSIPLTALPAPDIKIGSRRPVVCIVPRDFAAICDPFHIRKKSCGPPFGSGCEPGGSLYFAWGCFRDFLSRPCRAPDVGDSSRMRRCGNPDRLG